VEILVLHRRLATLFCRCRRWRPCGNDSRPRASRPQETRTTFPFSPVDTRTGSIAIHSAHFTAGTSCRTKPPGETPSISDLLTGSGNAEFESRLLRLQDRPDSGYACSTS
jgi:hypothetical protein